VRSKLLRFAAPALAAAVLSCTAPAAARPFELKDVHALVNVSSPVISPDGKRLVYVRGHQDVDANTQKSELILIDLGSGRSRRLTPGRDGAAAPLWSPNGDRLAFIASPAAGKPGQIFVLPMDGGEAQQITEAANGVDDFEWRPDGTAFAFVTTDDASNKKDIEKHHDWFEVTDEHFLRRAPTPSSQLWLIGSDGKNPKRLTSGPFSIPAGEFAAPIAWLPGGSGILLPAQADPVSAHFDKQTTLLYDFATGQTRPLAGGVVTVGALVSPDGARLAFGHGRHDGNLYLQVDVEVRDLTDNKLVASTRTIDRSVSWFKFMPDSRALAIGGFDGTLGTIWIMPLSGPARKLNFGNVSFTGDGSVGPDGTIAFVGLEPTRPREIYLVPPGGQARRITDENGAIAALDLGKSERIDYLAADGQPAAGVLTYPVGYVSGKRYPLIELIHGGPVSTSTEGFSSLVQLMAAHGWLVLQPNYRGSDNMGDRFLQGIVGHVTSNPGADNLAAVAAVEKMGIVDSSRIGVSGWSGGGLQTSWLIGHSRIFKAAVMGAAVTDWYEQAVLADINEDFAKAFFPGVDPFTSDGRRAYDDESPITFARNVKTPTLILSDTNDQRVPIVQSYAFYHALRDNKTTVKFVAFPRTGHFPGDPAGIEDVDAAWIGWFEQHL
jgi:dipeptidyl aminopeptidase/acylaminoacyl peptidase